MPRNLDELKTLSDRLASLVADPNPGIGMWNEAIGEVLRGIAEFAPVGRQSVRARDPRVDPMRGDVLRLHDRTIRVHVVEDGRVHYSMDGVRTLAPIWVSLAEWREIVRDAEVITTQETPG